MTLNNRFDMGESSPVEVKFSFTKTIWTPRSVSQTQHYSPQVIKVAGQPVHRGGLKVELESLGKLQNSVYTAVRTHPDSQPVCQIISSTLCQIKRQATRLFATLTAFFGIYGNMAYNVVRRISEIGIRLALGARTRQVLWMILRESSSLALFGITAGLVAAIGLPRFVGTMLFRLQPTNPATFIPAALLLLVIAIAAGYGPARRASRIDAMQALRHE